MLVVSDTGDFAQMKNFIKLYQILLQWTSFEVQILSSACHTIWVEDTVSPSKKLQNAICKVKNYNN
jgi:hypothetical protein